MAAQDDQSSSYLKSTLGKYSPWTRSPMAPPSKGKEGEPEPSPLQQQHGQDHRISTRYRLSLRQYPRDCPPLRVQWFHAVDAPKRRPNLAGESKEGKPLAQPKKYAAFSKTDSKAIEAAFQKLAEQEEAAERGRSGQSEDFEAGEQRLDEQPNRNLQDFSGKVTVPVNEDYLFDVDVGQRELGPAYWLGPVYDVRRGTWFYQDGSVQRPCDENLASQLEEGYLKLKAWRLPSAQAQSEKKPRSTSQPRARPTSWGGAVAESGSSVSESLTSKSSNPDLRSSQEQHDRDAVPADVQEGGYQNTYRLFGTHMNSVVTYQDGTSAWLMTDDFLSRMNYSMYQRFAGGGHFAGMKMTRGYLDPSQNKKAEVKDGKGDDAKSPFVVEGDKMADKVEQADGEEATRPNTAYEARRQTLERQMSSLLEDSNSHDPSRQDEELRRRDEKEIEDDYREADGDEQGREIEHLILVTHGIGQRLGLRLDSVNFVHDVNTLRKTLKAVYADSPDLRALNAELDTAATTNSRIQVLPICWRHLLDFPRQSLKHNRKEHDLADSGFGEEEDYPKLDDISVEGVPAVRNLITDLALDILLYQSPAYKDHISRIVLEECNRIYHLFMRRNPSFNGKISLVGHSLGSAIIFDILCKQDSNLKPSKRRKGAHPLTLDFEVEDFYALGSPIGLFQMLKGRTIVGREGARLRVASTSTDDPMLDAPPQVSRKTAVDTCMNAAPCIEITISSPKCAQIFNIFHPTDPIAYRIEPLISPAMSSLKPQPLPYTKRGIFGAPIGQGLTGIGARVGQSVSSLWSSVSTGLASSLLTRGLGYTGDEPSKPPNGQTGAKFNAPLFSAAGTNIQAGVVPPTAPLPAASTEIVSTKSKLDSIADATVAADSRGQHPPTLIHQELETLYAGYQKRRKSAQADSIRDLGGGAKGQAMHEDDLAEAKERGERLGREEEKVRRLNSNGRVDYAIQEGAFDINILAAIASHLSYWGDEDVSHFMISQLLSRHRVVRARAGSREKAA